MGIISFTCFESEIYRPTVYELLFITGQKVILNQHSYFHLHMTMLKFLSKKLF